MLGGDQLKAFNHRLATTVADSFGGDAAEIEKQISAGDFGFGALGPSQATKTDDPTSTGAADFFSRLVQIETVQVVGANVKSASATSLFRERDAGLFQRLLASPATRAHILWAKFLYGVAIGLIQLVVLFMAGELLFGIQASAHFGPLIVVSVFAAAACTSFGMLLAAIAPNVEAASGLATFLILLMSAIGGA